MDPQLELEALACVDGPLYTQHRDEWLRRTQDAKEILERHAKRRDLRSKVTARILLAWLEHRGECQALLDEIDRKDWEKWRRTAAGVDAIFEGYARWCAEHPELHGWLLPLSWEAALKRREEWDDDKRRIFFQMMQQVPDELTIELLFFHLRVAADTRSEKELAVFALRLMPPAMIKPRLARLRRDADETLQLFADEFGEPLVRGR